MADWWDAFLEGLLRVLDLGVNDTRDRAFDRGQEDVRSRLRYADHEMGR